MDAAATSPWISCGPETVEPAGILRYNSAVKELISMCFEQQLKALKPFNEQEAIDREVALRCLQSQPNLYLRDNELVHITASSWIVNHDRAKVLMAYHNIMQSWAWLGGHADGETDLLKVALREAHEESGVTNIRPVMTDLYSVEMLTVDGHVKRGKYVNSHLHLNATYLLEADENDPLFVKEDENSGVKWIPIGEVEAACSKEWDWERIYKKLNEKLLALG